VARVPVRPTPMHNVANRKPKLGFGATENGP
jgi:hypothetical protein